MFGTEDLTPAQRVALLDLTSDGCHAQLTMRDGAAHLRVSRPLPDRLANVSVDLGEVVIEPDGSRREG